MVTKILRNNGKTLVTQTTLSEGVNSFTWDFKDGATVFLVKNPTTGKQNFKALAGNGIQGSKDLIIELLANEEIALSLESGAFKNVTGEMKGKGALEGTGLIVKIITI